MLWALAAAVLGVATAAYNASFVASITALLDTLLDGYDNKLRPNIGGDPLRVTVHMSVLNIGPVSEKDMEFTMDCYFRQSWVDSRLEFQGPLPKLLLASKVLKDIWRPDTYIRLTIRTRCPMYLKKVREWGGGGGREGSVIEFPMDTQICPVILGSLGYSTSEVVYYWKGVGLNPHIDLSQYKIRQHFIHERNITDLHSPEMAPLSTLETYFELERQQGYYILQIYTPCSLIVVMSWVSFWINKEASPARVVGHPLLPLPLPGGQEWGIEGLGVMTVLTMSTLGLGGRDDLPKVTYSTAMDIYIVACFGFVFASLLEYALINFAYMLLVNRRKETVRESSDSRRRGKYYVARPLSHYPYSTIALLSEPDTSWETFERRLNNVGRIDSFAKVFFPTSYLVFNVLYWLAFLYWIPDEIHEHVDVPSYI